MQKEYAFEFAGTEEDLRNKLNIYQHNTSFRGELYYYFDDYIVKIIGNQIHFGIARGGHSSGYWFIPTITKYDGRMEFRGTIQYITYGEHQSQLKRKLDKIEEILLCIFFLPLILLIKLYLLLEQIVRTLLKKPKQKEKTSEERLYDLMENYLDCVRK